MVKLASWKIVTVRAALTLRLDSALGRYPPEFWMIAQTKSPKTAAMAAIMAMTTAVLF